MLIILSNRISTWAPDGLTQGRARELLQLDLADADSDESWICPECGVDVEGNFDRCWKCGLGRNEE